ncbi:Sec-independent protein translocase subunit TatA [Streptomyces sp. NPDC051665]|uniref:Sec-independent protein translocase subunit TatA n=1 Tax=Streptomyces sp. NPDC051665 TaxID=3154647 RepID=UPI003428993A
MLRNGLEPWHLLVVAIVIIVLFGSKKLPEAARGLGKSMRILKSEAKAMKDEGASQPPAERSDTASASDTPAARLVQSAPGDATLARPVSGSATTAG